MKMITRCWVAASAFVLAASFCSDVLAQKNVRVDVNRQTPVENALFAMPGNANAARRYAIPYRMNEEECTRVIVDEDFSAWVKGTEEQPDTVNLVSKSPYIDNSLTKRPGWSGYFLYQAGGVVAMTGMGGGAINTPLDDYSGDLTVTFRAKSISEKSTIIVSVARGDIWNPQPAGSPLECIENFTLTAEEGWKDFTFKFRNYYSDNDGFVQLNIPYRKVLIDDIKVVSEMTDFIAAPQIKPATDFNAGGFTANWGYVYFAENYELSVYQTVATGTDDLVIDEAFENAKYEDGVLTGVAEGLQFKSVELSENEGAGNSQGIIVSRDDAEITFVENGGNVKACSVWFKMMEGYPDASSILIEKWDGLCWSKMNSIALYTIYDGTDKGYLLDLSFDPLNPVYNLRLRFTNLEEDGMKLCMDSLHYETSPAAEHKFILKDKVVDGVSEQLEGLDPYGDYYYYVKSVNGDLSAISSPIYAFGLTTPVAKEATDVDSQGSYTANWEETPKASRYKVTNYRVYTANENMENYPILNEDFSKITTNATSENPEVLNNDFVVLNFDEYTENAGWTGSGNALANGMLGCYFSMGYSYIATPPMTLNNNSGNFRVTVKAYGYVGDILVIEGSSSKGDYSGFQPIGGGNSGLGTIVGTMNFTGGSANEVLKFYSYSGYPVFIDEIIVEQTLQKGDRVFSVHSVKNTQELSTRFSDLDTEGIDYAYDVTAYTERFGQECVSGTSNRVDVVFGGGVGMESPVMSEIFYADGKMFVSLSKSGVVNIFDMLGRLVKSVDCVAGENVFDFSGKGVYLVVADTMTHKVVVQ